MSKSVTEYGVEITDILSGTPDSLQGLQSLLALYKEFMGKEITALTPRHRGGVQGTVQDGRCVAWFHAGQGRTDSS